MPASATPSTSAALHLRVFAPVLVVLAAGSWAFLWFWSAGPYSRYLDHGNWLSLGPVGELCRALPGGEIVVPALIHASGWVLMIVAMMLPTTLPLLGRFERMTASRADASSLLGLVIAGYLGAWLAFGIVAHGLDWAIGESIARLPSFSVYGWTLGAGMIAAAGIFQFTPLKYRCLEQCRTPLSFISHHWHGVSPRREAFALGLHHGAFCVGCCWALMLLMFVVGTANLGWMMALGAVMALEKNMPWGRRMSAPLGYGLLAISAATIVVNL